MGEHGLGRRAVSAAAVWAAVGMALPRAQAQARPEKSTLVIAVGGKTSLYYLPLTLAERLGFFKAEGLRVEVHDGMGGARALQSVLGGAADVLSVAYERTLQWQTVGQVLQAFVLQGRAPQIAIGVSMKTLPAFTGVPDLRGRRIGVTNLGASSHMLARLLLSRYGVKASEVRFVGVGAAAEAVDALRTGQIDAISTVDPVMTLLEQRGEVRVICDTRTLKGTQELFGGPMPAACLCTPPAFLQAYPRTAQALADAIVHALKWLQTAGPGDLLKALPAPFWQGDRAAYLAAFHKVREAISPDGVFPPEGGRTAWQALRSVDASLRTAHIDLDKTYTNLFALKAKARFKA